MPATMTATAPERTETWSSWSNLPVGTDEHTGEQVCWDMKDTPHMLIAGRTGSGKTTAAARITHRAFAEGFDVRLIDAMKLAADYAARFDLPKHTALNFESAHELVDSTHKELERRISLNRKHEKGDWRGLPPETALRPVLLVVEQIGYLLRRLPPEMRKAKKTNELKISMLDTLAKIAREGCPAGVHLLLITQRPDASVMGYDDFMRSLGARLLMGESTPIERQMMFVDDIDVPEHIPAGQGLFHTPFTELRLISTN